MPNTILKQQVYRMVLPREMVEAFSHSEKPTSGAVGRPGRRCMKLDVSTANGITRFGMCYCLAAASLPSLVAARG
jgi:hypothetical protein